ncbi:MAG TPA: LptE family protein [Tepidisphaeraceae bacterium]|nr:LptE family protein [Tepidisphaeraceae bacterium]
MAKNFFSSISLAQLGLLLLLAGCGYQSDNGDGGWHWGSVYRQDIHSVAVPIFTTKDFHQGVEYQLSDALAKKIEEFTPYKVEPRERADTVLEGEIVSVTPTNLTMNPFTDTPQEQQYSIIVDFTWKDLRTGKILVSRQAFEQTSTFFPYLGEGQYIASQSAVEGLALGIVNEMEGPW